MLEPKKSPHLPHFSTSAATHGFHVPAWWATTHVGSERALLQTHTHTVFISTIGGGGVLCRDKIRNQTSFFAKHKFTSILLIFGCRARVNHSAAWLAVAEKQPQTAAQLLSSHYSNKTPHHSGVRGNTAVQLQRRGWEREDEQLHTGKQFFKCLKKGRKKVRQLPLFPVWRGMYSNIRLWLKEDTDRSSQSFWRLL